MSGNFKVETNEPVGFKSLNLHKGTPQDKECQTLEIPSRDEGIQSSHNIDTKVQTDEVVKTYENTFYDEIKLSEFLSKITPSVLKELDKAERSRAFLSPFTNKENSWEVKELYTLNYVNTEEEDTNLEVLAMSWSCTGSTIAIGSGHGTHLGWCTHRSHVRFYNIDRREFSGSEPHQLIGTKSCVTALSMHPFEPSVIAVGTHSGDVLVWNLNKEGNPNLENSISHADCVTQLCWATVNTQSLLVSSSLDGHIFVFKVVSRIGSIILEDRYLLGDCILELQQYPGVSCFSFSPSQEGVFVAGLEGGTILQCSLLAASTKIRYGDGVMVKDPTVQRVKLGNVPITSIAFSPYEDNLYIVSMSDNKFELYSFNKAEILHTFWCNFEIWGAAWSPSQANAIVAWGASSGIAVYETSTGDHIGTLQLEQCEQLPLTIGKIVYNKKSSRLMAVTSKGGNSYIWEVPTYFKVK